MLPIRQHLLTLTCLKSTAKTVLIEVCELAENGRKGGCFASNATLSADLGISLATVVRTVASLVEAGLLTSNVVKAEANRRYLRPTAQLRTCYTGGTEAQQLAAAADLTIVKKEVKPDLTIVKSEADYSQNSEVTIVKSEADYSQNASRVYGDDQYDQVTTIDDQPPTPEEWAGAQKKIAELELENSELKAKIQELVPPVAEPPQPQPAQPAVESPGPRYSEASLALVTVMAGVWSISRMPRHGGLWGLLCRYAHAIEQQGKLSEAAKQFEGYRLHRQKRNLGPHNLQDFLGSEAGGFAGLWCQYDWPTKAQQAKAEGEPALVAQPAPRVAAGKKFVND